MVWGVGGYFYCHSDVPGAVLKCLSRILPKTLEHTADFIVLSSNIFGGDSESIHVNAELSVTGGRIFFIPKN